MARGRPKKIVADVPLQNQFEGKIKSLKKELDLINICNELINLENPFKIEIKDKELFDELNSKFKEILQSKVLHKEEVEILDNRFTREETVALKQLARKVLEKKSVGTVNSLPASGQKPQNFPIDFVAGQNIRVAKSAIFVSPGHGSFMLPIGTKLAVIEKFGEGKIRCVREDGIEGSLNISDVEKN